MNRIIASLIVFATFVFAPLAAAAALITVPAGLAPGDSYRLAFVTSTSRDATSSDIADYNAFVTNLAINVAELSALGTTWHAIASTASVNARTNTSSDPTPLGPTGVPIYRLDGLRIAADYDDLWNHSIAVPMRVDENGNFLPGTTHRLWTGSVSNGTSTNAPLGSPTVSTGLSSTVNGTWIHTGYYKPRSELRKLYAMSGILTVPTVPEPGTMALMFLATIGLAASSLRRSR